MHMHHDRKRRVKHAAHTRTRSTLLCIVPHPPPPTPCPYSPTSTTCTLLPHTRSTNYPTPLLSPPPHHPHAHTNTAVYPLHTRSTRVGRQYLEEGVEGLVAARNVAQVQQKVEPLLIGHGGERVVCPRHGVYTAGVAGEWRGRGQAGWAGERQGNSAHGGGSRGMAGGGGGGGAGRRGGGGGRTTGKVQQPWAGSRDEVRVGGGGEGGAAHSPGSTSPDRSGTRAVYAWSCP